jgi:hypothetical protein
MLFIKFLSFFLKYYFSWKTASREIIAHFWPILDQISFGLFRSFLFPSKVLIIIKSLWNNIKVLKEVYRSAFVQISTIFDGFWAKIDQSQSAFFRNGGNMKKNDYFQVFFYHFWIKSYYMSYLRLNQKIART